MSCNSTSYRQPPLFSVVIPLFNRRREVARALTSVVNQDFTDFEVVVVDDGSSDGSAQVVEDFIDPRIRLVRHPINRGVCPARNTGVDHAEGEWVVFLDSDDELIPGALGRLHERIREAPEEVDRIACMYQWDDGSLSPEPRPEGEVLDYAGYFHWMASLTSLTRTDFNNCIRRSTFERVRLPDGRAYEAVYHLDFARQFRTWLLPDVIAMGHQDAPNRISSSRSRSQRVKRLLQDAPDGLLAEERIISEHGPALKQYLPLHWRMHHRIRILFAFLAGQRAKGLRYTRCYLRKFGSDPVIFLAALFGTLGPRPLAWLQAMR